MPARISQAYSSAWQRLSLPTPPDGQQMPPVFPEIVCKAAVPASCGCVQPDGVGLSSISAVRDVGDPTRTVFVAVGQDGARLYVEAAVVSSRLPRPRSRHRRSTWSCNGLRASLLMMSLVCAAVDVGQVRRRQAARSALQHLRVLIGADDADAIPLEHHVDEDARGSAGVTPAWLSPSPRSSLHAARAIQDERSRSRLRGPRRCR